MAMEVRRVIAEAHEQPILCVAYNAQRREIFTGSQDTTIKAWGAETGELVRWSVNDGYLEPIRSAASVEIRSSSYVRPTASCPPLRSRVAPPAETLLTWAGWLAGAG